MQDLECVLLLCITVYLFLSVRFFSRWYSAWWLSKNTGPLVVDFLHMFHGREALPWQMLFSGVL